MQPAASRPSAVPWPPILFVGVLALGYGFGRYFPLQWPGLEDPPARAIGFGFGLGGLGLVAWGLLTLLRAGTTVLPDKAAGRLVMNGAFAFRRHPIYLGETLLLLGIAQATSNIWFALLAPVFAVTILALSIMPEERHLEERFGKEYLDYKARTRMWF